MDKEFSHTPVLLKEVMENLITDKHGCYFDLTFGRGGHTKALLAKLANDAMVIGIDKDPSAIESAAELSATDQRFSFFQGTFTQLQTVAKKLHLVANTSGILLDLGVSSPQLDEASRGFSFNKEGPLDMRMDPNKGISAAKWISSVSEEKLASVLKEFGEERFAKRIAHKIIEARTQKPIQTTHELAEIIKAANPKWEAHKHPATRSFQAIRIFINNELEELKMTLEQSLEVLKIGGRLCVITFHSLEDRIVKNFIRDKAEGIKLPKNLPILEKAMRKQLKKIGKALQAQHEEIVMNPRARSAKLRIAEKLA